MPYQVQESSRKLSFGAGYQTYYDLGLKRKVETSRGGVDRESTRDVSGGLNTLALAGAINIQDKYFIGAAFNKSIWGEVTTEVVIERGESKDRTKSKGNRSGSFLTIGGLAKVNPELAVGLMYRSGFEWDADKVRYTEYEDGELTDSRESKGTDWTIPRVLGLGVEYKISPGTIVVGELQTRSFSDYEFDSTISNVDNGYCYRLGAEFQNIVPTVRVGLFRDAIRATDAGDESPKSLMGLTGGLGFSFGTIDLDTAFEYGAWSQEDSDGDKYQEHLYRFRVSARYNLE